ncbi:hypothetical protein [uncultured Clostridium sp.]|uniref:hypothetical protein n=1 Tax=uncultured Clostridium sp. TaxID=59620 RepID=UPI0028EC11FA|nr:hypothetical protein [uncultured Clostridium sp.]
MNEWESFKEGWRIIKEQFKPIFIGIMVFMLGLFISVILTRSGSDTEFILWGVLYLSSVVAVCTSIIVKAIKNKEIQ